MLLWSLLHFWWRLKYNPPPPPPLISNVNNIEMKANVSFDNGEWWFVTVEGKGGLDNFIYAAESAAA